jgi:hypothetical protein
MSPTSGRVARRFTLVDAMVLIAASGIGFVMVREYLDHLYGRHVALTPPHNFQIDYWWRYATFLVRIFAPLATSLSLALWVPRLKSPRPGRVRLLMQPGMIASTAVVVGTILFLIKVLTNAVFLHWSATGVSRLQDLWLIHLPYSGELVAVTWILLLATGRWRSESSWIDRAGRVLGVYWIVSALFFDLLLRY